MSRHRAGTASVVGTAEMDVRNRMGDRGDCEVLMRDGEEVTLAWEDRDDSFGAAGLVPYQETDFGRKAQRE